MQEKSLLKMEKILQVDIEVEWKVQFLCFGTVFVHIDHIFCKVMASGLTLAKVVNFKNVFLKNIYIYKDRTTLPKKYVHYNTYEGIHILKLYVCIML